MNPIVYIVDDDAAVTAALLHCVICSPPTITRLSLFLRLMISWLTLLLPFPVA